MTVGPTTSHAMDAAAPSILLHLRRCIISSMYHCNVTLHIFLGVSLNNYATTYVMLQNLRDESHYFATPAPLIQRCTQYKMYPRQIHFFVDHIICLLYDNEYCLFIFLLPVPHCQTLR
jgi:hypothetical protein